MPDPLSATLGVVAGAEMASGSVNTITSPLLTGWALLESLGGKFTPRGTQIYCLKDHRGNQIEPFQDMSSLARSSFEISTRHAIFGTDERGHSLKGRMRGRDEARRLEPQYQTSSKESAVQRARRLEGPDGPPAPVLPHLGTAVAGRLLLEVKVKRIFGYDGKWHVDWVTLKPLPGHVKVSSATNVKLIVDALLTASPQGGARAEIFFCLIEECRGHTEIFPGSLILDGEGGASCEGFLEKSLGPQIAELQMMPDAQAVRWQDFYVEKGDLTRIGPKPVLPAPPKPGATSLELKNRNLELKNYKMEVENYAAQIRTELTQKLGDHFLWMEMYFTGKAIRGFLAPLESAVVMPFLLDFQLLRDHVERMGHDEVDWIKSYFREFRDHLRQEDVNMMVRTNLDVRAMNHFIQQTCRKLHFMVNKRIDHILELSKELYQICYKRFRAADRGLPAEFTLEVDDEQEREKVQQYREVRRAHRALEQISAHLDELITAIRDQMGFFTNVTQAVQANGSAFELREPLDLVMKEDDLVAAEVWNEKARSILEKARTESAPPAPVTGLPLKADGTPLSADEQEARAKEALQIRRIIRQDWVKPSAAELDSMRHRPRDESLKRYAFYSRDTMLDGVGYDGPLLVLGTRSHEHPDPAVVREKVENLGVALTPKERQQQQSGSASIPETPLQPDFTGIIVRDNVLLRGQPKDPTYRILAKGLHPPIHKACMALVVIGAPLDETVRPEVMDALWALMDESGYDIPISFRSEGDRSDNLQSPLEDRLEAKRSAAAKEAKIRKKIADRQAERHQQESQRQAPSTGPSWATDRTMKDDEATRAVKAREERLRKRDNLRFDKNPRKPPRPTPSHVSGSSNPAAWTGTSAPAGLLPRFTRSFRGFLRRWRRTD